MRGQKGFTWTICGLSDTDFAISSIVTMAVSFTVFEIKRQWSKKANFSYQLVFNLDDPLESLRIFPHNFYYKLSESQVY